MVVRTVGTVASGHAGSLLLALLQYSDHHYDHARSQPSTLQKTAAIHAGEIKGTGPTSAPETAKV